MINLPHARQVLNTSPEQDDLLETRIQAVVDDFNKKTLTKWDLATADKKLFRCFAPLDKLFLARPNVTLIEVKTWDRTEVYDGTVLGLVDDAGDGVVFGIQATESVMSLENEEGWNNKFVQVEFTSGYSVCPFEDMIEAILYQVRYLDERYSGERLITDSIGFEGGNTRFTKNMPIYKDAIQKYKVKLP